MSGSHSDIYAQGPPYPLRNQGLGGQPDVIPDVPITAAFLVLYLVFGIIHIKIFKANKDRGHKFVFNGAILGLCKIRIITMSLRIAWSCYPRNVGLGIAANVFVYVGTIILFMINWFFVQRIVRAQHQRLGWSTPYRIFHRVALVVLILCLFMIIIASIWQFFTIDETKLHVFRVMQLTGQTYFTAFCFAPAVLVLISALIPRHETEKFGAGRLRVNITILLIAVMVLGTGQLFRCVIAWIRQTRVRDDAGAPVAQPWYLHRACFYCFNFATEIVVVIMFALVRIDLRFHVPNGSRMSGDYSGRNSRADVNNVGKMAPSTATSEKNLVCTGPIIPTGPRNDSSETVHQYETSIFEESHTLADSLQYESSTLEVDEKTGAYKVKRLSAGVNSVASTSSLRSSARSPNHDRSVTFADNAPPVPEIPAEWPLRGSMPALEPSRQPSRKGNPKKTFEIPNHELNHIDVGDAITDALSKLEQNSKANARNSPARTSVRLDRKRALTQPPAYSAVDENPRQNKRLSPLSPLKRATFPPKSALKTSSGRDSAISTTSTTPTISETTKAPPPPPVPRPAGKVYPPRPQSLELITLSRRNSLDSRKILDMSLHRDIATDVSTPDSLHNDSMISVATGVTRTLSEDSKSFRSMEVGDDKRSLSFDLFPAPPVGVGDERGFD